MMASNVARILVVDDDAETGKFLEEKLSRDGCKAVWFRDPQAALLQLRPGGYQAGILDLKMPQMDGVELFRKLRAKDPELGLIVLTGYPSVDSVLATLKNGAFDYIKKPYDLEELRRTVYRVLEAKGVFLDLETLTNRHIGLRIREFRVRQKWTVAELAAQTSLSKSLISQLENAKTSASLSSLVRIARKLKIKVGDLVQDL